MRLTVLGSSASYAGPGRACAGHLIEAGETRVLFDCGNGSLANLAKVMDPTDLDAIFISHYHPDHYVDLFGLHAALRYSPYGPLGGVDVFVPDGLSDRMKCMLSERGVKELEEAFTFHNLEDGVAVPVGDMVITPMIVSHTEPTFGLRAESNGAVIAYTADAMLDELSRAVVAEADLVLAEATLPSEFKGFSPHMTPAEAGQLAREAGARQLVMIHIWPGNDREDVAQQATAAFGHPAFAADEFDRFEITAKSRL